MIEHKHLHYNCSLNDLSIFFYSLAMDGGEWTHEVGWDSDGYTQCAMDVLKLVDFCELSFKAHDFFYHSLQCTGILPSSTRKRGRNEARAWAGEPSRPNHV
jgi:hypothetical protein